MIEREEILKINARRFKLFLNFLYSYTDLFEF